VDKTVAGATALLAANGVALLKALEFIETHYEAMTAFSRAIAVVLPVIGLGAAYRILTRNPSPFWERIALLSLAAELALWCGAYRVFGTLPF
jgi:hypothetical protein